MAETERVFSKSSGTYLKVCPTRSARSSSPLKKARSGVGAEGKGDGVIGRRVGRRPVEETAAARLSVVVLYTSHLQTVLGLSPD